ncbi:MAG: bifunctional folylpolyglutamate synthase/dihydrofolate synthase [Alphaproteobacteria bacterium]|nr:bifunctional folylpolyglutamate synthase/dihydrofolate synthase [Alphaproteobacteria bacterium]
MSRIEGILARLHGLHPRLIDLSLGRLEVLLAKLGHPEQKLPPVIHVAGTNGKGSTCAFARAIAEAAGLRVHVYTSPHLVRFNERIRIAGELVADQALAQALEEVESANRGAPITVFEVITAAAFQLFRATPAELCLLEVGLGGRGDATNVIARPSASAITSISLDHREMLGDTLGVIAREKAGILKPSVPVAIGAQEREALGVLLDCARAVGAPVRLRGADWDVGLPPQSARPGGGTGQGFQYQDRDGVIALPKPALIGDHQHDNAGIAIAALRAARPDIPPAAIAAGVARATWPARLERLSGALARCLPGGFELWLDGGHNPGAAGALASQLRHWADRPVHLVVGMKQAKDSAAFLRPLLALAASVWAVAEDGQHLALPVEAIVAASGGVALPGPTVRAALAEIAERAGPARVLICGSLYLAGEVLKQDAGG